MPSVETMIKRVHAYREQIENDIIAGDARALMFLFSRAERRLTTIQKRFSAFAVSEGGLLQKRPRTSPRRNGSPTKWLPRLTSILCDLAKNGQKGNTSGAYGGAQTGKRQPRR